VVLLIDVDTGDARELLRVRQPQSFDGNALSWTPDGHGVLVKKTQSGRPPEVVMIPIGGGEPRKLEISAPSVPGVPIRVHPDGSQVAFTSGKSGWEISVLESFLPKTKPQP
jgi:Tol biopolymer transport system component